MYSLAHLRLLYHIHELKVSRETQNIANKEHCRHSLSPSAPYFLSQVSTPQPMPRQTAPEGDSELTSAVFPSPPQKLACF